MRIATAFTTALTAASKAALATACLVAVTLAHAGGQPFDKAKFDAALAQGKPVIVDFVASWCPTCKEQKPLVDALMQEPQRKNLTLFVADFDKEEALKKRLKVTMQSTFIVIKGGKEVARSTGQTDKAEIAKVFDQAL